MVRFNALLPAGLILIAGAALGWAWNASSPTGLHAQSGTIAAVEHQVDRTAAYTQLDQQAKRLQQPGQLLWHVKRVAQLARPFVVHLESKKREGRRLVDEAGAGILLERNQAWYVLTNRHVIDKAERDRIVIELDDGRRLNPERILTDADTDLAVMAITPKRLTSARIGNSRTVEVGDFVLAVGSPFGLSRSVSFGIVSAIGRRDLKLGGDTLLYQDFLQTDAAINPGNSGGPLLNARGEVIGLNTAIASSSGMNEGLGFAIPINMALYVAHQLIDHGAVRRSRIGVSLDREFDAEAAMRLGLARLQGTRLTAVEPGAPADMAGVQVGDVILEFDGVIVESDVHLVTLVSMTAPGKSVRMVLLRDGRKVSVSCTLAERGS